VGPEDGPFGIAAAAPAVDILEGELGFSGVDSFVGGPSLVMASGGNELRAKHTPSRRDPRGRRHGSRTTLAAAAHRGGRRRRVVDEILFGREGDDAIWCAR
jgi:hypothetical protein